MSDATPLPPPATETIKHTIARPFQRPINYHAHAPTFNVKVGSSARANPGEHYDHQNCRHDQPTSDELGPAAHSPTLIKTRSS